MARTVDESMHAHKRAAILDAAAALVSTKGYERMSLQEVITRVGISKGAFYHYFDSKPALLEALIGRISAELADRCRGVAEDPTMPAQEKLGQLFHTMTWRKAQMKPLLLGMLAAWYSDDNAIVRQKLRAASAQRITPLLARILRQGTEEGAFGVPDPENSAMIVWSLAQDLVDGLSLLLLAVEDHDPLPRMRTRITAYTQAIERMLAMRDGTLLLVDATVVADWVSAHQERGEAR